MNDDNYLAKQLNSFSISSEEEKLTQRLGNTHIVVNTTNSIFSLPPHLQQHVKSTQQAFLPPQTTNVNNNSNQWNNASTDIRDWTANSSNPSWNDNNTNQPQDEGWGEGPPSYTSISQGTYFGFNSIMEAPKIATMSNPNDNSFSSNNSSQQSAFNRYKNNPVTFTSASTQNHQK